MRVFVTGASGFVGTALLSHLVKTTSYELCGSVRAQPVDPVPKVIYFPSLELESSDGWAEALRNVDVVVHTAARVHVMKETEQSPMAIYRSVNVDGVRRIAQIAAQSGVGRFIFLSSVKVNGESTPYGQRFRSSDSPQAIGHYANSKLEAEIALREVESQCDMNVVILRPPLVYGHGVSANFGALMRLVRAGIPLPFSGVRNKRSLVSIENLVSLIALCCAHPSAGGGTFMVSDDEDVSIGELVELLGNAMDRSPRLFYLPPSVLRLLAFCIGKRSAIDRLLGSLQVDISDTKNRLGWAPVLTMEDALVNTVHPLVH